MDVLVIFPGIFPGVFVLVFCCSWCSLVFPIDVEHEKSCHVHLPPRRLERARADLREVLWLCRTNSSSRDSRHQSDMQDVDGQTVSYWFWATWSAHRIPIVGSKFTAGLWRCKESVTIDLICPASKSLRRPKQG